MDITQLDDNCLATLALAAAERMQRAPEFYGHLATAVAWERQRRLDGEQRQRRQDQRAAALMRCLWCSSEFEPRGDGGKAQRFCQPACRRAFDGAARTWVRQAVETGRLTVAELCDGPTATRALLPSRSQPCPLPDQPDGTGAHRRA